MPRTEKAYSSGKKQIRKQALVWSLFSLSLTPAVSSLLSASDEQQRKTSCYKQSAFSSENGSPCPPTWLPDLALPTQQDLSSLLRLSGPVRSRRHWVSAHGICSISAFPHPSPSALSPPSLLDVITCCLASFHLGYFAVSSWIRAWQNNSEDLSVWPEW